MLPEDRVARFEKLLTEQAYNSAWRYCCLLAHRREDAEDLFQESLLRAIGRIAQLREPDNLRGWLLSIVRSTFLNTRRKRSREMRHLQQLGELRLKDACDGGTSPVVEELAALPHGERMLLTLFYLEGLSLRETAQALGLGEGAAQSRLQRAREVLRRRLAAHCAAGGGPKEECHAQQT